MPLRMVRNGGGGGKETQFPLLAGLLIEDPDGAHPGLALAVVDFPEVKHLPLDHAPGGAFVLGNAVISVRLAVFEAPVGFEKHTAHNDTPFPQTAIPKVCTKGPKNRTS